MLDFKMPKLDDFTQNASKTIEEVSSRDVAVIGMSIKVANAKNTKEFWDIIANKKVCIKDFPSERKKDCDKYLNYNKTSSVSNVRLES